MKCGYPCIYPNVSPFIEAITHEQNVQNRKDLFVAICEIALSEEQTSDSDVQSAIIGTIAPSDMYKAYLQRQLDAQKTDNIITVIAHHLNQLKEMMTVVQFQTEFPQAFLRNLFVHIATCKQRPKMLIEEIFTVCLRNLKFGDVKPICELQQLQRWNDSGAFLEKGSFSA